MSKTMLMIVGVLVLVMGILALIPSIEWATEPTWHAIVKIVVGLISLGVAAADKPAA
jgi:uncharacterized membrane protein SirB2